MTLTLVLALTYACLGTALCTNGTAKTMGHQAHDAPAVIQQANLFLDYAVAVHP